MRRERARRNCARVATYAAPFILLAAVALLGAAPAQSARPTRLAFPNPSTTGVPAGWVPKETLSTTLVVTTPGAVVEDVLMRDGAYIGVRAPNVTIRRVRLEGGGISNYRNPGCYDNMVIEDSTFEPPAGASQYSNPNFRIDSGQYTARRVKLWHVSEGFRVQSADEGCTGVTRIEDSFVSLKPPDPCGDWHGDGIQGWNGGRLAVRNVTIDMEETADCGGTSPFFYPNQGNARADVNRLLVAGRAGFMFRLGVPGTVSGLRIEDGSWHYGPIDNACQLITSWEAKVARITRPDYRVTSVVRDQPCDTVGGGQ